MGGPILPVRTYVLAYLALIALVLANVFIGMLNLGWGNMFAGVTIATMQAGIIAFILMHGLLEKVLVRLIMGGALLWFMIFMTLTLADYITRNWVPIAGK
jgi:caa(3)-type oxidase subunit IV